MIKKEFFLRDDHSWQSEPGYKIFVADRGAVRFDVPSQWIMKVKKKSVVFHDLEPPAETAGLEMSFNHLPPNDWQKVPVKNLLQAALENDSRDIIEKSKTTSINRDGMRLALLSMKIMDAKEKREATSHTLIGLGGNIQVLITFDYWSDDIDVMLPIWETMLRSLRIGLFIPDPTSGHIVNPSLN